MDSIERAIRDALARGDARDRAYRERVYRSVLAALERANAANPDLTPEAVARRKDTLKSHITAIEREFMPAEAPAVDSPASAERAGVVDRPASSQEVYLEPSSGARPEAAPEIDRPTRNWPEPPRQATREDGVGASAEDRLAPRENDESPGRRPYAAMFVAVTFVAALAIGAWWATETGLFGRPDTSVPNPPPELEEEDFTPEPSPPPEPPEEEAPRDWVTLFSPSDPSNVNAPSGASAELVEADGESYLSIRSGPGGEGVLFDVPAQVLAELAGRGAVFDIVARAEEGQETQISVTCNFGELGDCGRQRYLVGYEQADYLFDVDMPRGAPGSAGTIAIISDVSNGGRAVHIFEIRVAPR